LLLIYVMADRVLNDEQIAAFQGLDSCMVSNAIETFGVRLRNTGFADSSIRCMFRDFPPMVGYAVTARLRSEDPPIGGGSYHDRTDWWNNILRIPAPRVVVLEDMDKRPGLGAFIGDVHASILRALGCVGYVTNGAVRELPGVRTTGLHLFAGDVAVSHAYAHIFDFDATVTIGGMLVHSGDLLHGDRHGVITVPKEIAAQVPAAAARLRRVEECIIGFCNSDHFSLDKLREVIKELG
jgi:4-hydroxy-4-methyl-2-oxoglutarate aldolase